jgi:hypothetical protein
MKNYSVSKLRNDRNTWLMVAAIMGGLMAVSSVQAQNLLLDTSFELGASPKVDNGYSGGGGDTDVPSWFTPGATAPTDSGAEQGGPSGRDGTWAAYLKLGEAGTSGYAAQTTSYVIQSGDSFNLSLLGSSGYTFDAGWGPAGATLHYSLYYGGDATTMGTVFGDGYIDLGMGGNPFSAFSVSGIAAPGAADGQVLGIAFYNSSSLDTASTASTSTGSWIYMDNVSLTVAAVPEPTSAALLGLGALIGVLDLRRRRA